MKKYIYSIVVVFFVLMSCSDDDGPSLIDSSILPGEGLEDVKIGYTGEEVIDVAGRNYFTISTSVGSDLYFHRMDYDNEGLAFNMGSAEEDADIKGLTVQSVTITAPFKGTTAEGIGIGNTKQEVLDNYPDPEIFEFWQTYEYEGISFIFDESDVVVRIFVNE